MFPSKLRFLKKDTFKNYANLARVGIPTNISATCQRTKPFMSYSGLGGIAFTGKVSGIPCDVFRGYGNLRAMRVPSAIGRVRSCTFDNYTKLAGIGVPGGMARVSGSTFLGYDTLGRVRLPRSLNCVKSRIFGTYATLRGVAFPSQGVTGKANSGVFTRYDSLGGTAVPSTIAGLDSRLFSNMSRGFTVCKCAKSCTRDCTGSRSFGFISMKAARGLGFGVAFGGGTGGTILSRGRGAGLLGGKRMFKALPMPICGKCCFLK